MASPDRDPKNEAQWTQVEEAIELLQEHRFEEALLQLRDVITADPHNAYAYHFVGTALFELQRFDAARDAYEAAVRVAPDYLGARVSLSHVLRGLGDPRGAMEQAEEAIRRFPTDAEARHALALAQAAAGKRPQARENLEAYLASDPEFEAAQEVRAILEMLGVGNDDEPFELDDDAPARLPPKPRT